MVASGLGTRLHPSVAPEGRNPSYATGCYRIIVEGWPNYELNLHSFDPSGNNYTGMEAATGLWLVNTFPQSATHLLASFPRSTSASNGDQDSFADDRRQSPSERMLEDRLASQGVTM